MKTATLIQDNLDDFVGHAALYFLNETLDGHHFVVVSAVHDKFTHETYIFPADEDGNVTDWGELEGSTGGTTCHATALKAAGYVVQEGTTLLVEEENHNG